MKELNQKFCRKCRKEQPLENFSKCCARCKECEKDRLAKYYNRKIGLYKKTANLRATIVKLNRIIKNQQIEIEYLKEDKK